MGGFAEMATIHLNPHVQQFGVSHEDKEFPEGRPKFRLGAAGNPHYKDSVNPTAAPTTKTHRSLGTIRKIRQSSLNGDFGNKLNLTWRNRVRVWGGGVLFTPCGFLFTDK